MKLIQSFLIKTKDVNMIWVVISVLTLILILMIYSKISLEGKTLFQNFSEMILEEDLILELILEEISEEVLVLVAFQVLHLVGKFARIRHHLKESSSQRIRLHSGKHIARLVHHKTLTLMGASIIIHRQ